MLAQAGPAGARAGCCRWRWPRTSCILTGLLFFTGGPFNPFSFLYLVHIALAAVVLRAAWTWALVALSLVCSGALFYAHVWLKLDYSDPGKHAQHMRMHLEGMWIAFAVAAAFIVYFVTRVRRALAGGRPTGDSAPWRRNERLAALATLAAGAAHELATPLGTIAVVARELERTAERQGPATAGLEDLRLIRAQVERCRTILDQMAADAGASRRRGIRARSACGELVALARSASCRPSRRSRPISTTAATATLLAVPPRALAQALRGSIKNAQDASAARARGAR